MLEDEFAAKKSDIQHSHKDYNLDLVISIFPFLKLAVS